jgi:hypothetical protein
MQEICRRIQTFTTNETITRRISGIQLQYCFEFVDPLETRDASMDNIKDLYRKGLTPINITVDDKGKQSQAMVFLGDCRLCNKEVNIPLLKYYGASTTQKVIGSSLELLQIE